MASARLSKAISVIGRSKKLGQRSIFRRTGCIIYSQDRNHLRLFDVNDQTPTLLIPQPQATKSQEKNAPYRNAGYPTLLETLGDSYMDESKLGVTDASKALHEDLLKKECTTPKDTLFS